MPFFERDRVRIYYEVHGEGFPVLCFAPGALSSSIPLWQKMPWGPMDVLASDYQLILMDQRNAGQSSAPIDSRTGWDSYRSDQLALLDHLGIERCHLFGCCIGCSFILHLLELAPERVESSVLMQPVGSTAENAVAYQNFFDDWAGPLEGVHPDMTAGQWKALHQRMFGGDFVFCTTREAVRRLETPMLVLMGCDLPHPPETAREIVELAPHAELVEQWKDEANAPEGKQAVVDFLRRFTSS